MSKERKAKLHEAPPAPTEEQSFVAAVAAFGKAREAGAVPPGGYDLFVRRGGLGEANPLIEAVPNTTGDLRVYLQPTRNYYEEKLRSAAIANGIQTDQPMWVEELALLLVDRHREARVPANPAGRPGGPSPERKQLAARMLAFVEQQGKRSARLKLSEVFNSRAFRAQFAGVSQKAAYRLVALAKKERARR